MGIRQHGTHCSIGLGHSHATGASLASVLKEGRRPYHRSSSRGRDYLFPSVQSAIWKLEQRIANAKESSRRQPAEEGGGRSGC